MRITSIQLAQRIQRWQKQLEILGIGHFRIDSVNVADTTPSGPSAKASVTMSGHYDYCTFWFTHETLDDCTPSELDELIVHEWLHVAFRDFEAAFHAVEKWMPAPTYEDWNDRVEHESEGVVDRLAKLIVALHA